ncbi:glutamate receptor ionotropic, kainate 5-like isoform X1 [Eriocheir sinensis]|uniref:glutamate receptor ionotropic, kainate 5-like isoform X1 n=1 Tax=Eriocheir sinensis TaxID=95602 RepID=UPI0021C7B37A|nr:glutamate receptor ionotropic, kainate 5-like isoform X1 [Eriocheir sinensis]
MDKHRHPKCLTALMVGVPSLIHVSGTPGNHTFTGPVVVLLDILAEHLRLCLEYVMSKERVYGRLTPNGSWEGMMGIVQRREVDMTGALFTVSSARLPAADFSEPIYTDEMTAMYIRPGVEPNIAGFLMPYTPLVWLLVGVAFLLNTCAMVLVMLGEVSWHSPQRQSSAQYENVAALRRFWSGWLWALKKSFLWTWSTLLAVSVFWNPVWGLTRYIGGLWLIASLILDTMYRSNLKAMLTIQRANIPFNNVEELADSNIPIAIYKDSTLDFQIMRADPSTSLGRLKDQLVKYYVDEVMLGIDNTYKGQHASTSYKLGLPGIIQYYYSKTGKCDTYIMSHGYLGPSCLSLAFPKGSHHKEAIDAVILRLRETGIINKVLSEDFVNAPECMKPLTAVAVPMQRQLQLLDFLGVFALYSGGIILASISFLLELTSHGPRQTRPIKVEASRSGKSPRAKTLRPSLCDSKGRWVFCATLMKKRM